MNSRASGRLALMIAAVFVFAASTLRTAEACEVCSPTDAPNAGKAANALPTYPEASEDPAAPVSLKKFTRTQSRAARRAQSRNESLAQRAKAGKLAARKATPVAQDDDEAPAPARTVAKVAPTVANAKAELVELQAAGTDATEPGARAQVAVLEPQAGRIEATRPPAVELVAAEEFNELDRAAWEANQMPKLMKLTASDSRAEHREDDSKWAQTSMIGKLFVAFGALLTLGSAIRMFMA